LKDLIVHQIAEYEEGNNKDRQNTNIKLNILTRDDGIFVYADKERIARVVDNLLMNAVNFTKEGTITITIKDRDLHDKKENTITTAIVNIMDTGEGIAAQIYSTLFTKFATTSHTGTGLGLFISKYIFEAHGGRIWAENNPDGKGATFSFSLPLTSQD
jgi:signal transduction histidine kinase